ncbi:SSS family solute:Na+ symporter [Cucurbitaria berberidis CBS 394.84]|uniref:SSS family solute:Na+ symporter n=1 Tax=Cucurbitaria berberidis CBS 394.84 TaxID=1168544 RepID=A0A9P4GJD1_9PLEO|nr:SSS family solute:Na+ symporter [Cucurbitaria berberidis CBS 394.84]KAF1846190.1 SSS family solute:Na+ symporter [Cucurbitaria berberidis CBS 394.84]
MSDVQAPLPQGAGYGVVVGLGVTFALGMIWVTKAMKKSFNEDNNSTETFMVANRSVGTGLTSAVVIASWLYSTALLAASSLTYRYGVALGVWWGASASTMICLMAYLCIEAKRKAPNAHTMLEIIKGRYGSSVHILWIFLALMNNALTFSSMLLGASTAITSLTGMNITASTYLLPLGVAVYTYFGGLRATFLTDYVHTFIIMIVLVWFTTKVIVSKEIGSIGALYDAVVQAGIDRPVAGNYKGSYLTMRSEESIYFGILHVVTNFGVVIMDTGFWQKGFSADVAAAVPGYILGGIASFSVPWAFGTIVGLAALALEKAPSWPTYPNPMSSEEVGATLVLPYVAQAVAGKGGAAAILLVIFMSCTSIASAQMIATSSIISFDIYGTYVNKKPTDKELIRWSHIGVVFTSLFISSLATAFHRGGVDMTWTLYMMGNLINPGIFPTMFALLWKRQTKTAAIVSPIFGMACGLSVWFGTAYHYFGEITIKTTGATMPCLFGCITSFAVPLPTTVAISLLWPAEFDWNVFATEIKRVRSEHGTALHDQEERESYFTPERVKYMKRMSRLAAGWATATILGHVLLWPVPMFGAKMTFSKGFFIAWIVISLIWLWLTLLVSNFYPLIDGGANQIWTVVRGRKGTKGTTEYQTDSGNSTPPTEQFNATPKEC